jgi:hypothetical protein
VNTGRDMQKPLSKKTAQGLSKGNLPVSSMSELIIKDNKDKQYQNNFA